MSTPETKPKPRTSRVAVVSAIIVLVGGLFAAWYFLLRDNPNAGKHKKEVTGRFVPADAETIAGANLKSIRESPVLRLFGLDGFADISSWPIPGDMQVFLRSAGLDLKTLNAVTIAGKGFSPFGGPEPEGLVIAKGSFDKNTVTKTYENILAGVKTPIEGMDAHVSKSGGLIVIDGKELVIGGPTLFRKAMGVYTGGIPSMDLENPLGTASKGIDRKATLWFASKVDFPKSLPDIPLIDISTLKQITHMAGSFNILKGTIEMRMSAITGSDKAAQSMMTTLSGLVSKALVALAIVPGTASFENWIKNISIQAEGSRISLSTRASFDDVKTILRGAKILTTIF